MFLDEFIDIAIKEAKKSPMYRKHGAVLIYRNKIVGKGHNVYHNYKRKKNGKYFSIHAEVMAIKKCNYNILDKCVMIVVRVSGGEQKSSRPCKDCQRYLKKMKIRKILHS